MPSDKRVGVPFRMFLTNAPLRLWQITSTGDRIAVHLAPRQLLEVYWNDDEGGFRCTTREYSYTVADQHRRELVRWHFHPDSHPIPHIHVTGIQGHVPSGRVTFESIIRFLIEELAVEHRRGDWDEVLATQEGRHRSYRTWT